MTITAAKAKTWQFWAVLLSILVLAWHYVPPFIASRIPDKMFVEFVSLTYDPDTQWALMVRRTPLSRKYPWLVVKADTQLSATSLTIPPRNCTGRNALVTYEVVGSDDDKDFPREQDSLSQNDGSVQITKDTVAVDMSWATPCLGLYKTLINRTYSLVLVIDPDHWLSFVSPIILNEEHSFVAEISGGYPYEASFFQEPYCSLLDLPQKIACSRSAQLFAPPLMEGTPPW